MAPKRTEVVVIRRTNANASEGTAKEAKRLIERELRMREGIYHLSLPAVVVVQLDHKTPFFVLSHHPGKLLQDVLVRSRPIATKVPAPHEV
ncbi:MAG: hypothetical protein GY822_02505 [Deltaproteobacteria bacterium]|nr:hypothetical protein [Deltaproteobacteria bacterium]